MVFVLLAMLATFAGGLLFSFLFLFCSDSLLLRFPLIDEKRCYTTRESEVGEALHAVI